MAGRAPLRNEFIMGRSRTLLKDTARMKASAKAGSNMPDNAAKLPRHPLIL